MTGLLSPTSIIGGLTSLLRTTSTNIHKNKSTNLYRILYKDFISNYENPNLIATNKIWKLRMRTASQNRSIGPHDVGR